MNTILNLLVKYFNLVNIINNIKCKGILRDIILYLNNGKVTRFSKLMHYDLFVVNTENLRRIKYRMARNKDKHGYLILDFKNKDDLHVEFSRSLIPYIFRKNVYAINIRSDAYLKFLKVVSKILISKVGELLNELDKRHMTDIAIHMYDDTIQLRSKINVFNLKLSQLQFASDDIDLNHDFYVIKNINGMYIVLPVDQVYTLKDDLDDYIFITRNEYINNILEPLKYFTPSEKVIIYRDYRNIIRHNIFDEYRKKKIG